MRSWNRASFQFFKTVVFRKDGRQMLLCLWILWIWLPMACFFYILICFYKRESRLNHYFCSPNLFKQICMTSRFLKKILCLLLFCGMCAMKQQIVAASKAEPVDYVNPYMGNISHLLVPTYPIVHLPNSMLRVYPQRGDYTSGKLHGLPMLQISHRGSFVFRACLNFPVWNKKSASSFLENDYF